MSPPSRPTKAGSPTKTSPPTMWRYTAVDVRATASLGGGGGSGRLTNTNGELAGTSAAEVRGALRRIGLQVIDLRPVRQSRRSTKDNADTVMNALAGKLHKHLRRRRSAQRAELYDSLATMLSAGLPLLEAVQTLIDSHQGKRAGSSAQMLMSLREQLRSGSSLAQAMQEHPGWFDELDLAIIQAGQHSGSLPQVLSSMAQRQEKANELGHKLIGALAYPFLVLLVGLSVAVFLSVKTLPELVTILENSKIAAPQLTVQVMWGGQMLVHHWPWIGFAALVAGAGVMVLPALMQRFHVQLPQTLQRWHKKFAAPKVMRILAVGGLSLRLAQLLRSGVPMVEALRVIAPTASSGGLRQALKNAATRIEQGDELSTALDDHKWFDAEFRRLLDIGQSTGELDGMLQRIGERYQRQAQRLIDRLATLLEPLVILLLAVLVGGVVMAAILPLLRLQEIL